MFLFNSWSKAKRQVKSLTSFNHVDFLKTGQESLWIKWWISLDGGLFVLEKVQLYIYIYINLVIETIVKTETSAYKIIQIECSMRRQSGITQDENTSYFIEISNHYRSVSCGKCSTYHTHQVNNYNVTAQQNIYTRDA